MFEHKIAEKTLICGTAHVNASECKYWCTSSFGKDPGIYLFIYCLNRAKLTISAYAFSGNFNQEIALEPYNIVNIDLRNKSRNRVTIAEGCLFVVSMLSGIVHTYEFDIDSRTRKIRCIEKNTAR